MRSVFVVALGSALAMASVAPSFAQNPEFRFHQGGGQGHGGHGPGGGPHMGGGGPRFGGGERFGGGFEHRRRGFGGGAAIGAGVAGLAAGALIGGAIANRGDYGDPGYYRDPGYAYGAPVYADPGPVAEEDDQVAPVAGDSAAYCAQRYRSYDPESQSYLGYDGARHPCP